MHFNHKIISFHKLASHIKSKVLLTRSVMQEHWHNVLERVGFSTKYLVFQHWLIERQSVSVEIFTQELIQIRDKEFFQIFMIIKTWI